MRSRTTICLNRLQLAVGDALQLQQHGQEKKLCDAIFNIERYVDVLRQQRRQMISTGPWAAEMKIAELKKQMNEYKPYEFRKRGRLWREIEHLAEKYNTKV